MPVPLSMSSTRPPRAAATVRPSGLTATAGRPPIPACSGTQAIGAAAGDVPATRPVSIQRSSTPSSSGVSDRAPTPLSVGGMKSSSRWAARKNSGLSAEFFEIAAGPESPPAVIAARLSSRSPPSDRWALWQAVQFAARIGAMSVSYVNRTSTAGVLMGSPAAVDSRAVAVSTVIAIAAVNHRTK